MPQQKKPNMRTLKVLQAWLIEICQRLEPEELDRGNAQGFAQLVRQLVVITRELETLKREAAPKATPQRAPATEADIDEAQKRLDQWRDRLDRRRKLGITGDRAVGR